jgi:Tol biopolymer transport system component
VTTHPEFDGFPMFSPDGTKLVWAANRNSNSVEQLDIYIADWTP